MNEIDELYVSLKYNIPRTDNIYFRIRHLPMDFLIKFGYYQPGTISPEDAYFIRSFDRDEIIQELIQYEQSMAP